MPSWQPGRARASGIRPKGDYLIYFAADYRRARKIQSWTAICRPPWLTALALWPGFGAWHGGGLFMTDNKAHLNQRPAFAGRWASQGPGLLEKANAIRAKLAEYGITDKPLFITEVGWYSNDIKIDQSSPEEQARYVLQFYAQSLAAGNSSPPS